MSLSSRKLAAVQNVWHDTRINVLDLARIKQLTGATFEAVLSKLRLPNYISAELSTEPSSDRLVVIAKITRFEWEILRIERETRAYQVLQQQHSTELDPRFLGHIQEGGRVMGLLLEKLGGLRHASIDDLKDCELALGKFHKLGFLHGDVNKHNYLVGKDAVKVIDFEHFQEAAPAELTMKEMQSLKAEFLDTSGRGGGFIFSGSEE